MLESRRESVLKSPDGIPVWTVCIDRAPLEPLLCDMRKPMQRCLQSDNPALRLLSGYLASLFSLDCPCDPLVSQHIRDLALYALGITGDAQALVRERGVTHVRLHAALDRLKEMSAEARLDPSTFAERLRISVRYLHHLLEPTGRTFSEHLLKYRLERAAAMLRDPKCADLRIGNIADRAGFTDISHFNRSFRRSFGESPRAFRKV